MTNRTRAVVPAFATAGFSIVVAVFSGAAWLGQPLRMVHLLTIVGLSVGSGVAWAQAVARFRERRLERSQDAARR